MTVSNTKFEKFFNNVDFNELLDMILDRDNYLVDYSDIYKGYILLKKI